MGVPQLELTGLPGVTLKHLHILGRRHSLLGVFSFFYLAFLARTFMIHRTAGEGGGYLFNSSVPLPPASQTLTH